MAWRRSGDKPLSEPVLTPFTDAYIYHTRGRWVNGFCFLKKSLGFDIFYDHSIEIFTLRAWGKPQNVISIDLTDWGWVTHICITNLGHRWFRKWLVAFSVPSRYLNQSCIIVNWTLRNKPQSNCTRNSNIFIEENAFKNLIWKMSVILSWPQCVNRLKVEEKVSHLAHIFNCIFIKENFEFWFEFLSNFVHMGPVDNKLTIIQH